uniref:Uncharacterized protein n=1 Tax=Rhizophora mucronata TaxID=61149 RepID=A0A2P2IZC6_RHIMU
MPQYEQPQYFNQLPQILKPPKPISLQCIDIRFLSKWVCLFCAKNRFFHAHKPCSIGYLCVVQLLNSFIFYSEFQLR